MSLTVFREISSSLTPGNQKDRPSFSAFKAVPWIEGIKEVSTPCHFFIDHHCPIGFTNGLVVKEGPRLPFADAAHAVIHIQWLRIVGRVSQPDQAVFSPGLDSQHRCLTRGKKQPSRDARGPSRKARRRRRPLRGPL